MRSNPLPRAGVWREPSSRSRAKARVDAATVISVAVDVGVRINHFCVIETIAPRARTAILAAEKLRESAEIATGSASTVHPSPMSVMHSIPPMSLTMTSEVLSMPKP